MMAQLSVIIPTMNRPNSLNRTLEHMSYCTHIPSQVIVVDQSQEYDIVEENKRVCDAYAKIFGSIEYLYQSTPSSTKARNYGFSHAYNEIIVFADDDVDVESDTFSNVLSLFSDNTIAMVAGVNSGSIGKSPSTLSRIFGLASFRKRNIGHMARACYGQFPILYNEQTPTEWAMGFFFAVRKSLMIKWNLRFDEKLKSYAYAEDLDFSYGYYKNAKSENLRCIMSKLLLVTHNVSTEYRIPKRSHIYMTILHRYYISHKYRLPLYELNNLWGNIGLFLRKVLKKERPKDVFDAQMFYYKHRSEVLKGGFLMDEWV